MNKVFYDSTTLEIKGYSDGDLSMEHPFVETDYDLVLMNNFKILELDGKFTVEPIKMQFTDEEWEAMAKPQ